MLAFATMLFQRSLDRSCFRGWWRGTLEMGSRKLLFTCLGLEVGKRILNKLYYIDRPVMGGHDGACIKHIIIMILFIDRTLRCLNQTYFEILVFGLIAVMTQEGYTGMHCRHASHHGYKPQMAQTIKNQMYVCMQFDLIKPTFVW